MSNPQAVIPDSFAALANLTRALEEFKKTQATPQGPAGPTVAMQAAQAAQQASQPFEPQAPEGQPAPPQSQPQPQQNGIASIAQNAGIGAQIQAQQQQAAQQAMMAQAQQAQPQQMASGGIAGLNAHNMHGFKEGGVLGFQGTGEQGQRVPEAEPTAAELEAASKAAGLLRRAFEKPDENVDLQRAKDEAARANAVLNQYGIIKKQNDPQGLEAAQRDADAARKELLSVISNQFYAPQGERKRTVEGQKDTRDIPNAAPTSMMDTRDVQSSRPPVAQAVSRPVQQTPRPPAQTGPESVEGMIQRTQKYAQDVDTTEQRNEVNRLNKMRADQPLAGIEQLAAYRRAQEEYDTAAKERKESFGSRQFRELMRDMSMNRNGEGMARVGEEERRLTEADTTRRLTNAQLSGLIVDAQNAKKVGDQEKYIAAIKDVNTILKDNADRKAQLAGQSGSIGASLYNTDTMANLDRIKISTMREANDLTKTANSIGTFNAGLAKFNNNKQAIIAELDKVFNERNKPVIALAGTGDKTARAEFETILGQHEAYKANAVKPINDQIYKTERAMYEQHEKAKGLPPPVNLNDAAFNAPTGFNVTKLPK
jgi:hypothetical protein